MNTESIKAELGAHDAEMRAKLNLNPSDDWWDFKDETLHAADIIKRLRLLKRLEAAQSGAQVVALSPRGT